MNSHDNERGFLGARVRTWQKWWYVAFIVCLAMLVGGLIQSLLN